MKTLINILIILSLSSFLMAQTDSTATEAPLEEPTVEAVEPTPELADTTEVQEMVEAEAVETDSAMVEFSELDSMATDTTTFAAEDTVQTPEAEMGWVQNDPVPTALAGLVNEGNLYFWTNDMLDGMDFTSLPYISIVDPTMIAVNANDCLDIVCHLLASDGNGVNYVVVTKDDSSDVQIYNTVTKVVAIEAPADSIVAALDAYLKDIAGSEYVAIAMEDTSAVETLTIVDQDELDRQAALLKTRRIRNRQFRALDDFIRNPANLAREFDYSVSLNILPDIRVSIRNSLLTPGWYKEWWTVGGVWDEAMKEDYLSTLEGKNMVVNISPNFPTLFGFSTGNFSFNLSGQSHLKMKIPGNLLGLPFKDILLNEPADLSGLEVESIPFMGKATLSYGQPLETPIGEIKVGLGLNTYKGVGYISVVNHEFTQIITEDSIITTTSGEGWATQGGIEGKLDDLNTDDFDPMSTGSDITFGIDLGAIMNLEPMIHQDVEVQVSLKNIGASYKWSGLTHEAWTFVNAIPAPGSADTDSTEQYQTNETTVLGTDETLSIDLPTVFNLAAYYQPIPRIIIGLGIEKAFTDDVRFGYSPDLELYYQLNMFATEWLDLSYYHQTRYGEPVHTFGTGLHFGMLEAGLSLSLFDGINSGAKGIGFGIKSSLHF
ncbi:MAG: hypothetical protein HQ506_06760 [Candidatus Marinimicrobia bacterium]|nr:hypothetical protein [Candidatus Neomarinimicrobiota bacterium]